MSRVDFFSHLLLCILFFAVHYWTLYKVELLLSAHAG